jgi:bromodomain-containing protein 8
LEAPGAVIVRKLTIERNEELKRIIQEQQLRYKLVFFNNSFFRWVLCVLFMIRKLKREVELVQSGQADEKLKEIWNEIQKYVRMIL